MNNCEPTYAEFTAYRPDASVTAEQFAALVSDAAAYVDYLVFPNSVDATTDTDVLDAYKRAISAVCVVENDYPGGVAKSYTSGKVREDYDESSIPTPYNAAHPYLSGSGLLCRWL